MSNNVKSFAVYLKIIWIIGSSLIAKASIHTQNRPIGLNLGLNEKDYKLVWAGMSGMTILVKY
jgi:hypothetical protein